MTYTFYRSYPYSQPKVSQTIAAPLVNKTVIFHDMICKDKNSTSLSLESFYGKFIRLPSAGTLIMPETIPLKGFTSNLVMRLLTYKSDLSYWEVGSTDLNGDINGLKFFIISD